MLWEYIKEVLFASWEGAKGVGEMIELLICLIILIVPAFLKKRESEAIAYEKSLRKIFFWKFINRGEWRIAIVLCVAFAFHFLIVAPYHVYQKLKIEVEKTRNTGSSINWLPPKFDNDNLKFDVMFGGHREREPVLIWGHVATLDIYQVKATNGFPITIGSLPAITAHVIEGRMFFDLDVPTTGHLIEIRDGQCATLPEGWDWNCDSDAFEIVDDQRRSIFQEIYKTNNAVWIMGGIEYQGTLLISDFNGQITPRPRVFYNDIFDVGLKNIFKYPSSKYKGQRIPK
jgi:hypothetical protein